MNRKTYDLRGLRFLHVDGSIRCCIPQHVEITHKQGKSVSQMLEHLEWKSLEQRRKDARLTMNDDVQDHQ
jgi:hypothetical protein